jgi:hypothetical protein
MSIRLFLASALLIVGLEGLKSQGFTRIYRPLGISNELPFFRIEPAPNGGFYTVGRFVTSPQIVISRFDAQGKPLWSKIPADQREVSNIIALKNGRLLAFNTNRGQASSGSVLLFDTEGNVVEETLWGTAGASGALWNAIQLASGEVLALGSSISKDGEEDQLFIVKFSETGKIVWKKTWEQGGYARFSHLIEIPSGGFYITGDRFGNGVTALLCRFDANGVFQWAKTYDFGGGSANIQTTLLYPDGSLLFTLYSISNPTLRKYTTLFKTDAEGRPEWIKALSGPTQMTQVSLQWYDPQTILLNSCTSGQSQPIIDNDNLIIRLAPDGKLLGSIAFGSSTQDIPFDSYLDGDYLVACGITYDGGPEGSTEIARRAFISRNPIRNSGCIKNFTITETTAGLTLPTTGEFTITETMPPADTKRAVGVVDFAVSAQTTCQSVGVEDEAPCPGFEPDVLQAAAKNLNTLLLEKTTLADATYLRVFDCTGKTILETRAPNARALYEKTMPPGIYFYALELKACGKTINIAGKTAILSH